MAAAGGEVHFNRDIRPILAENCFACHGFGEAQSDLRLDSFEGATELAIVPGDVENSELIARILSDDPGTRMPPPESKKPALTPEQVALLKRWIKQGAEYEEHWAYTPVERPEAPAIGQAPVAWRESPIDRLLLKQMNRAGVSPSREADRVTLARRVYLDVIGLPPPPAEIDAFLADTQPGAYERLVDKLLASPRYAERMATWWFDLVRFANTVGYHGDQRHSITPYRDYVLKAFDENLPFDQFTIEQIAGDLLPPSGDASTDTWRRIATGYNRVLQTSHEGGIQDGEYRAKMLADRVRNVSEVWLGSSMGCAECHDHKFDPFTQRDFYAMGAFFADVDEWGSFQKVARNDNPTQRPPEMLAWTLPVFRELQNVDEQIVELEEKLEAGRLPFDYEKKQKRLTQLKQRRVALEGRFQPTMITRAVEPREVRVLNRGNWLDPTDEVVEPALPRFLAGEAPGDRLLTRLDLARWLVSGENPLTARVVMNRLWARFFGEGFSRQMIDVGSQSDWPTHPELLDWLAAEFVASGWDINHMVRQIVTSAAYRQSSVPSRELEQADPENRLLARQSRHRLEAEQVRDLALSVSGLLRQQFGGVVSKPYQPAGYYAQLNFPVRTYQPSKGADQYRRAVYTHWQRQFLHPWLRAFDAPSREECTAKRPISSTPAAALVLLNDPSFIELMRGLATRTLSDDVAPANAPRDSTDELRIRWAWREVTGREPKGDEVAVLAGLLADSREKFANDTLAAEALLAIGDSPVSDVAPPAELAAWTSVCRVLLNLSETITRN